ncbi:MAG: AmmeMemoRadiSam system protein B [Candidatus Omnitrophica bacterium]|nr:AmmeMemoRadiSam system protein B [Candidatus Omnitrophota bacterium]
MEKTKIRAPAVAGQFYPDSRQEIKKQIESFVDKKTGRQDAFACMLPHAGYIYSGRVAAETVSRIKLKDKIILLGPNHTGFGSEFSIMTEGIWQTPLGDIQIDTTLAKDILGRSQHLKEDSLAHMYEHSLEVELPLLQYFKDDFKIVPIAMLSDNIDSLKEVGKEIASSIKEANIKDSALIVASSDMTHYQPQEEAEGKDMQAIQAILELDEDKLMEKIARLNISMCGYAPVAAMLVAAKLLGAKTGKLVKYQTSGDITGDKTSVVGYAGIIIS